MSILNRSTSVILGVAALVLAGCADTSADTSTTATPAVSTVADSRVKSIGPASPLQTTPADGRDQSATFGTTSRPASPAVYYVKTDPEILDLGQVAPNAKPTGIVKLINTGEQAYKILGCKPNCGCTTTNCPKGQELAPGESTEIEVSISAGASAKKIRKQVTFTIEGHAPIILPVLVEVIDIVKIEPRIVTKQDNPEGTIVVRAMDGQPFRVLSADPPVIVTFPESADSVHELTISWELWEQVGAPYRPLKLEIDHPKAKITQAVIRSGVTRPPVRNSRTITLGDAISSTGPLTDELITAIRTSNIAQIQSSLKGMSQKNRDAGLVLAARYGQVAVIKTMLEGGAEVNSADARGRTPLIMAVRAQKSEAVKILLENGADINGHDNANGTALAWAAGPFGDLTTVKLLIEAGSDVNAADNRGMTPILWAARFGDIARVKALLAAGADTAAADRGGKSALDYAKDRQDTTGKGVAKILQEG